MHQLKTTFRSAVLYIMTVVVIGGVPMAAFADNSTACANDYLTGSQWGTDTKTGKCVLLYDRSGKYIGPDYMKPAPVVTPSPTPSPSPTSSPSPTTSSTSPTATGTTVTDSGNGNATGVDTTNNGTAATTDNNGTTVSNGVNSIANSGSAGVSGNESQGNATTGDTTTQATVVNNVNSVNGNNGVTTFSYDVNGNVTGDITLNGNNGPVDTNNTNTLNTNTDVNNSTSLTNNLDLNSKSGDATVSGNESKGNATSGSANTVADIINLINTIIAANQSFVGTINIYGNLNGDILLSPEFIPQLLASNAGDNNNVNASTTNSATSNTNINDNASIVNNVQLNAQSGNATTSGNESKGNATTGNTQTNLTILNLTGHTVNAANSLLVFVNVLGTWVGMIVDAPGATAAALGSGVTENNTNTVNANANLNNNSTITNNLNLNSQSGNADVSGNESRGNATSGNATASANISNLNTSTFNLTGWFGILYINVFGSWIGSFGVNTAAGTITPISGPAVAQQAATSAGGNSVASPAVRFGFTPGSTQGSGIGVAGSTSDDGPSSGIMQASRIASAENTTNPVLSPIAQTRVDKFTPIMMIGGFGIAGASGALTMLRRRAEIRKAAKAKALQTTARMK